MNVWARGLARARRGAAPPPSSYWVQAKKPTVCGLSKSNSDLLVGVEGRQRNVWARGLAPCRAGRSPAPTRFVQFQGMAQVFLQVIC